MSFPGGVMRGKKSILPPSMVIKQKEKMKQVKVQSVNTAKSSKPVFVSPIGQKLADKYLIEKHFDSQLFRHFYIGSFVDEAGVKKPLFFKMKHEKYPHEQALLAWEYQVYQFLDDLKARVRIPRPYHYGPCMDDYQVIVMDMLGPSLSDLWTKSGKRLSIRALAQLGYQLMCLMKFFHDRGVVYRNISPEHFLYGISGQSHWTWLHAVDLKWTKSWALPNTSPDKGPLHVPNNKINEPIIIGTPVRFMSINNHRGHTASRRDDLESVGYLLMYLYTGQLPWIPFENIGDESEQFRRIVECKESLIPHIAHQTLPELGEYLKLVRTLEFHQTPDYETLGNLFLKILKHVGYKRIEELYDWNCMHKPKT